MSVDMTAEASAICVEKPAARPWTPTSQPNQTTTGTTTETAAAKPELPTPAKPDPIKSNSTAEQPAGQPVRSHASIDFPVRLPESLDFHCVQPYELNSLTHLVRPVSLAVASLATGCALGMIPLVRGALDAVGDLSKVSNGAMLWYLIYAMIFALCSGVSIIAWINAFRGRSDARRLLREIRQRPNVPLSQIVRP